MYFPFAEYWWFYAAFTGFVLTLLLLDLGVFHRIAHTVRAKEAAIWSVVWISLALLFNYGFYHYALQKFGDPELARRLGLEFLTGFVVEKALSVDNLFVFVLIFSFFNIPSQYQHRILFYGILGALIFRAFFVAIGSALMQYEVVVMLFGGLLVLTGIKILLFPEKAPDLNKNPIIRLMRAFLPISPELQEDRFFLREQGKLLFTPLFIALVFIEMSDVIFAVDSVPAIFAITREPLIVFTSNIFAILGLRALYFLLASVVDQFRFLKYGLGVILIFVGLKMVWLNHQFGGHFPIGLSLGIIGSILLASVAASLLIPARAVN